MNRQQKEAVVVDFKERLNSSKTVFLVNYKGLSVNQLRNFRKQLRKTQGTFKVAKARLMKIAARDAAISSEFGDQFKGQVGLVFVSNEAPPVAKEIVNFAKENERLEVISGLFESNLITKEEVISLSSIPAKDLLFARLAGALMGPLVNLSGVLKEVGGKLARALKAIAEKSGKE